MLYQVTRRLYDADNSLLLVAGNVVDTTESEWVKRFGPDLRRVDTIPHSATVVKVEGTIEARKAAEIAKADQAKPASPAPSTSPEKSDKVVPSSLSKKA